MRASILRVYTYVALASSCRVSVAMRDSEANSLAAVVTLHHASEALGPESSGTNSRTSASLAQTEASGRTLQSILQSERAVVDANLSGQPLVALQFDIMFDGTNATAGDVFKRRAYYALSELDYAESRGRSYDAMHAMKRNCELPVQSSWKKPVGLGSLLFWRSQMNHAMVSQCKECHWAFPSERYCHERCMHMYFMCKDKEYTRCEPEPRLACKCGTQQCQKLEYYKRRPDGDEYSIMYIDDECSPYLSGCV